MKPIPPAKPIIVIAKSGQELRRERRKLNKKH